MQDKSKAKILLVCSVSPFAQTSGAAQRSLLIYQALRTLGEVDVIEIQRGGENKVEWDQTHPVLKLTLAARFWHTWLPNRELSRQVELQLGQSLADYNLIVGRYIWPISQLAIPKSVPCIVDLDDFKYRYSNQLAWTPALAMSALKKYLAYWHNRLLLHRFAGAFFVCKRDQVATQWLPSRILPNIVCQQAQDEPELTPAPNASPAKPRLLFVGSLWYQPNIVAVDWFLTQVLPLVRAHVPEVEVMLVGAAPQARREKWQQMDGVIAPGFVDSLTQAYHQASAVIAPVLMGGGSNIKVLEAIAYGKPCITTSLCGDAFAPYLDPDKTLLVADTPSDYAALCVQALRHPEQMHSRIEQGLIAIQKHYHPTQFQQTCQQLAQEISGMSAAKPQPSSELRSH
ncbi:glycosyltransferase family 4 protein [Motilimonas sp. KMU-193]|uniref:glycosyltransferase family 4 protein n=1 Tax=Motilimonas sp. KMU-193 TaxID=3388668 RepID=UPI00396B2A92